MNWSENQIIKINEYLFCTGVINFINDIFQGINWIINIESLVQIDLSLLKIKQLQHLYSLLVQGKNYIYE